jgi:hypothetical protein
VPKPKEGTKTPPKPRDTPPVPKPKEGTRTPPKVPPQPPPEKTKPPIPVPVASQIFGQGVNERGNVENINVNLAVDSMGGKYSRFLRIA